MGLSVVIVIRTIILKVSAVKEPRPNQVESVSKKMPYLAPYICQLTIQHNVASVSFDHHVYDRLSNNG